MYKIGDIIKNRRKALRFSQEELSFGICATGTLSKIENGHHIPNRGVFEPLMERLGLPPERYPSLIDNQELEVFNLRHDIRACIYFRDYKGAEELLTKFKEISKLYTIYTQFIDYVDTLISLNNGETNENTLKRLEKVLAVSTPDFKDTPVHRLLLSDDEIRILYNISLCYQDTSRLSEELAITTKLIEYVNIRFVEIDSRISALAMLYYASSKQHGLCGNYEQSLQVAILGIKHCQNFGLLGVYPSLVFNKGYSMLELGDNEGKKCIKWAYNILDSLDDSINCKIIENYAKERNIEL